MSFNLVSVAQNLVTDTWVKATWEEYLALANNPDYANARFYYDLGYMRIETMPLGAIHGEDNAILSKVVSLYATLKNIWIKELANTSFRKANIVEFQPDLAFYIGSDFQFPPRNNSPIDLNEFAPPNLIVEIASTSLNDDLGRKRLLYERLGVQKYWVADASTDDVIAFEIFQRRSGEIQESLVLPGLAIAVVEEALQRSQTQDDGEINRWLIQTFSQS